MSLFQAGGREGQDPADVSIGEQLGEVTRDLSALIRQEVELAKAELRQDAKRVGAGTGMLGGAGVTAVLTLVFVSVAAWWAIGNSTGRGWSALIVAAVWLVVTAALVATGRSKLQQARGLPQTTQTARQIPDALKGKDARP